MPIPIKHGRFKGQTIPDKCLLQIGYPNGHGITFSLRVMDDTHLMVGMGVYHIDQFIAAVLGRAATIGFTEVESK